MPTPSTSMLFPVVPDFFCLAKPPATQVTSAFQACHRRDILHSMIDTVQAFDAFFSVIQRLRAPDGCPWDREQTPLSLRSDLIEEVFEATEAISAGDPEHVKEELGDVILNAVMTAYMYQQQGDFLVADVFTDVAEKLVRRHPHVFKESEGTSQMIGNITSTEQVLSQWDAIKRSVEGRTAESILDEVPAGFPPLLRAAKLQKKAAKVGFDWKDVSDVEAKISEELEEVRQASAEVAAAKSRQNAVTTDDTIGKEPKNTSLGGSPKPFTQGAPDTLNTAQLHLEEEVGDLLFAVVNLARHLKVDPAQALARTNEKFCRRFKAVEHDMAKANLPMDSEHLEHMDTLWNAAKKQER